VQPLVICAVALRARSWPRTLRPVDELRTVVEGHSLTIDLAPLVAWERLAWLEGFAALALVVALALAALLRAWEPEYPALAVIPSIGACASGGIAWLAYRSPIDAAPGGSVLRFLPELGARVDTLGLLPLLAIAGAAGALLPVLLDVPSWAARRYGGQLARLALLVVPAGVGLGAHHAARDVRAHLAALDAAVPLPHLAFPEDVALHVGQAREVEPSAVTAMAIRSGAIVLFFRPTHGIADPGSPEDEARLASGERGRVTLDDEDAEAWGIGPVRVEAPREPGPFEVEASYARGPIRVTRTFSARAVSDAGDPRFPLEVGTTRRYASALRVRGGPAEPLAPLELVVERELVEDGFRVLVLRASVDGTEAWRERVVPWEGRYRVAPYASATLAFDVADTTAEGALGPACGFTGTGPLSGCECAAEPPLGPRRCTSVDRHTGEALLSVGLAVLTMGATLLGGLTPPDATVSELRLELADGVPVETPSALAGPARRRPR
jgi:hypothetical protein